MATREATGSTGSQSRPFAIVTGASSGIGFELAKYCEKKQAPDEVAKSGYAAMKRGEGDVVTGWQNKLRAAMSHVMPAGLLAEQHRRMAAPGTAAKR
jgi:short-subunit dehydrogenase